MKGGEPVTGLTEASTLLDGIDPVGSSHSYPLPPLPPLRLTSARAVDMYMDSTRRLWCRGSRHETILSGEGVGEVPLGIARREGGEGLRWVVVGGCDEGGE